MPDEPRFEERWATAPRSPEDVRAYLAYERHVWQQVDEAARECALRADMRKTFGLPDDTPKTDLF